jgi:hypothetical protein
VSPLKIKIPSKNVRNNQQIHQLFIQFIYYGSSYMFRHYIAIPIAIAWRRSPRSTSLDNTPIHNILLTAPQLSIPQKALGTLPEDGNLMPKHVGNTIRN